MSWKSNKSIRSRSRKSYRKVYNEKDLMKIQDIEELKKIVYETDRQRKYLEEKLELMKEVEKTEKN